MNLDIEGLDRLFTRAAVDEYDSQPQCQFCGSDPTDGLPVYILPARGYGSGPDAHRTANACATCCGSYLVSGARSGFHLSSAEQDLLRLTNMVGALLARTSERA